MFPNVLFIMVDAFRADHCWGSGRRCRTPVLDELIRKSTIFARAFSTASMTTCCTASILTGSYPFIHGIRSLADRRLRSDIPTLPEVFRDHGYYTWAEVTGPLMPITGLNRGFDRYNHREYLQWLDTEWGDIFLNQLIRGFSSPWFGFLHLWELHYPRRVMPGFDSPEFGQNAYERAVSSLDGQLGRLLDALPHNTIVVLTGDHGEYVSGSSGGHIIGRLKRPFKWLKKHVPGAKKLRRLSPVVFARVDKFSGRNNDLYFNWIGHGYHVYDYLVNVPVVLYAPGLFPSGFKVDRLVSHVDLFPTLISSLDFSDVEVRFLSGIDLMPSLRMFSADYHDRSVYLEASGGRTTPSAEQWLAGIRTDRYKYVRGLINETLPEELYDLEKDPDEQSNIADQFPDVIEIMRGRLSVLMQSAERFVLEDDSAYSTDEIARLQDRLRDLGYLN
jgi:arylsulfatase A-like enzyme